MFLSSVSPLESIIIELLQKGPVNTAHLIEAVRDVRPKTTKQGVYFALRNLSKQEITILHNKQVTLNVRWIKNMERFFSVSGQCYLDNNLGTGSFSNLKDGEKIEYAFSDSSTTDSFWWDALYMISELLPNNEPAYLYNRHEWFLIARRESELEAIKEITKRRHFLLISGGKTLLDKSVTKDFDGKMSRYHMVDKPIFDKDNYYFNIVGDFIIEVWIDKKISQKIEDLYKSVTKVDDSARSRLVEIIKSRGRSRLVISRNVKKAEKLKRPFKKHFYIKSIN